MASIRGRLFRLSPHLFGKEITINDFLSDVEKKKMVILGEYHCSPNIVQLQTNIQEKLAQSLIVQSSNDEMSQDTPKVRVIMEHFSMNMQGILNKYHHHHDTSKLLKEYEEIGTEGFNLNPYIPALESAVNSENMRLYGGFIPRPFARILMKEGVEKAIEEASSAGFIPKDESLTGTDLHYNYFESLLTGSKYLQSEPTDRFRKMFPAQIIKDVSMAWATKTIDRVFNTTGNDKILLVCGVGHMLYNHGVPERIFQDCSEMKVIQLKEDVLRVACLPVSEGQLVQNTKENQSTDDEIIELLRNHYGSDLDAADVCFVYEEVLSSEDEDEEIIKETQAVYDKVGNTAHLEGGDMKKAHAILKSLSYTSEEIEYAGEDAVNYQGVGNPHRHVTIKSTAHVLDMGSGLGVDSLIATSKCGPDGKVVGVDLSNECVQHTSKRATERGLGDKLHFIQSSIEDIGDKLESDQFDVIISNGAFCLLPNKKKGFSEAYRLLKSGGKISICTTVIKNGLEEGVEWPLCMQTFAKMDELVPMLEEVGFQDIEIDLSDSLMEEEVEIEIEDGKEGEEFISNYINSEEGEGRFKVHNEEGQKQFHHLENFDMNQLCARVVIKARKP